LESALAREQALELVWVSASASAQELAWELALELEPARALAPVQATGSSADRRLRRTRRGRRASSSRAHVRDLDVIELRPWPQHSNFWRSAGSTVTGDRTDGAAALHRQRDATSHRQREARLRRRGEATHTPVRLVLPLPVDE
jgi:hypothetical protein